jgi:ABC-2 type transport system ATP-binding protein
MATATASPAEQITVTRLTKSYKARKALDNLDLSISTAAITGLVGPQGAGKTTLLKVLANLHAPTIGRLDHVPSRVGALIDHPAFYPQLTGRQNLYALARRAGLDATEAEHRLRQLDLTAVADTAFRAYSMGTRQRLGVAAALLGDPSLLLLDEPTNGLDPVSTAALLELLRHQAGAGTAIVVATHHLDELATIADDLIVLRVGQLVWRGPINDLTSRGQRLHDAVLALLAEELA